MLHSIIPKINSSEPLTLNLVHYLYWNFSDILYLLRKFRAIWQYVVGSVKKKISSHFAKYETIMLHSLFVVIKSPIIRIFHNA